MDRILAAQSAASCYTGGYARHPADTIGYSTQPYQNPMQLYDDQGWGVPFTSDPMFMPPTFLNIESCRRDTNLYPDASSFALTLPHKLSGIRSIELLEIIVPSVASGATEPLDNYFFLYNGLPQGNTYRPQGIISGLYETLNMARPQMMNTENLIPNAARPTIKNPGVSTVPGEYTGPEATDNAVQTFRQGTLPSDFPAPYSFPEFGENSFGKFFYNSTVPVQNWQRLGFRRVFYFKPEKNVLDRLEFSLIDREGNLYDIGDQNWTATIMVTCRSR